MNEERKEEWKRKKEKERMEIKEQRMQALSKMEQITE